MTTSRIVNLRGWPGLVGWRAPTYPKGYADRLGERNALLLHAAADAGADGDRLGLGVVLFVAGRSIVRGVLLVADDLGVRDPGGLASVMAWAASHHPSTKPGAPSWEVLSVGEFFDPFATLARGHLAFAPNAYVAGMMTIGANLGRPLGLVAEHCGDARATKRGDRWCGGWTVHPPGWGKRGRDGSWYRRSPNRPELRMKARRVGWQVNWGPCGKDAAGRRYGKVRPGEFVDLLSLAYALDADRGASFAEHRENFGLDPVDLPLRVSVDAEGAVRMAEAVAVLHETALALDERAAEWFTTPQERAEGRGHVNLSRTSSPGALAAQNLARIGAVAPLAKFDLADKAQLAWAESLHGGRCWFDRRLASLPFPAVAFDIGSCFPLVAHLLGWWQVVTCEALERQDVTAELLDLCRHAAKDPRAVLDPEVWERFGLALVEVLSDGEPWPVEVEDEHRPDGRMEVVSTFSAARPMYFAWPDVVAAAISSGRVPRIASATRLVPVGRQGGLRRRVPLVAGLAIDVEADPLLAMVRHRRLLRPDDTTRAGLLRVVANSLCYGILGRFDECRWGEGRKARVGERPGPWNFVPIASSVAAGSRLLLSCFEAMVRERGGSPVYCDTDSWLVLASPFGGIFALPDGTVARALSWDELDEIAAAFSPLQAFGRDVPVWRCDRGSEDDPLWSLFFGAKRHAEFFRRGDDVVIFERTEANLGGFYADPATMAGRAEDGGRRWSVATVKREVLFVLSHRLHPHRAARAPAPWDAGSRLPAPALFRRAVVSSAVAASLPEALGARPGSRFVEGLVDSLFGGASSSVVALDPGGTLSNWQALRWFDRRTGASVRVTTHWQDLDVVRLVSLDDKAAAWSEPTSAEPISEVHVEASSVRHVGRKSGVIDSEADGLPGDLAAHRPLYEPELAALTRRCACGCGEWIGRTIGSWFSNAHRVRARRAALTNTTKGTRR